MLLQNEREAVVEFGKKLVTASLTTGTGGNLSVADEARRLVAISPTGLDYFHTRPEDVVVLDFDGNLVDGALKPSSEVGFHLALYNLRPDIRAVVHTHSVYATTIACLGWDLPAVHYLIGSAGSTVPCAPYATFGTRELAENICKTIGDRNAVLMANHGLVTVGPSLAKAFSTAEQIELVCRLYYQTKCIGEPRILSDEQMAVVLEKFKTYGQQKKMEGG